MKSFLVHALTDEENRRCYRGGSMLGTFRPGDYLTVEPVPLAAIRLGDVVVCRGREEAGEPDEIVHRVVDVLPDGLVTRGDNSPYVDSVPVTQDTLLGRVTHVQRGGQVRPVWGGRRGLLRARMLHARCAVRRFGWRWLSIVGRRPYRWLRQSGLVGRLWRPAITRVRVEAEDGPLVKYVHRGRTVARWWPERGRFRCRKPYDLVISRPSRRHPVE